jgi:hypothetical protein
LYFWNINKGDIMAEGMETDPNAVQESVKSTMQSLLKADSDLSPAQIAKRNELLEKRQTLAQIAEEDGGVPSYNELQKADYYEQLEEIENEMREAGLYKELSSTEEVVAPASETWMTKEQQK